MPVAWRRVKAYNKAPDIKIILYHAPHYMYFVTLTSPQADLEPGATSQQIDYKI